MLLCLLFFIARQEKAVFRAFHTLLQWTTACFSLFGLVVLYLYTQNIYCDYPLSWWFFRFQEKQYKYGFIFLLYLHGLSSSNYWPNMLAFQWQKKNSFLKSGKPKTPRIQQKPCHSLWEEKQLWWPCGSFAENWILTGQDQVKFYQTCVFLWQISGF